MLEKLLLLVAAPAVSTATAPAPESPRVSLERCVEAGNRGWVDGLKAGDAALIVAPYEEDGLDCIGTGECLKGRAAVQAHYADRIAKLGRATWAEVVTKEIAVDGEYAYEWGRAEARFPAGKEIEGRYLTVWRQQKDGSWKIFRNVPLP